MGKLLTKREIGNIFDRTDFIKISYGLLQENEYHNLIREGYSSNQAERLADIYAGGVFIKQFAGRRFKGKEGELASEIFRKAGLPLSLEMRRSLIKNGLITRRDEEKVAGVLFSDSEETEENR